MDTIELGGPIKPSCLIVRSIDPIQPDGLIEPRGFIRPCCTQRPCCPIEPRRLGNLVIYLGTVGAQLGHKIENSRAQLGHSRGTAGEQLGHKVTWGTVGAGLRSRL